jgi:hypothetical protein
MVRNILPPFSGLKELGPIQHQIIQLYRQCSCSVANKNLRNGMVLSGGIDNWSPTPVRCVLHAKEFN